MGNIRIETKLKDLEGLGDWMLSRKYSYGYVRNTIKWLKEIYNIFGSLEVSEEDINIIDDVLKRKRMKTALRRYKEFLDSKSIVRKSAIKSGKSVRIPLKELFYINNQGLNINYDVLKKLGVSEAIFMEKLRKGDFRVV
ncbi:hypothetical protein MFS40622_1115 [Methanocaldococcus sp. FS406-22]|uniref:hypothetical protein n=1 Tax=Methanocaldococcus sp. (strain FS406-22) TaxID=644281 RepID=UPI0001BF350D|nr:hypothetical protein [Methanocaldococcus sp. FS406-22]ADC69795.1 hypothetical protein MFS40622_1115 [Methanocaldococcus sp. FS406-22]